MGSAETATQLRKIEHKIDDLVKRYAEHGVSNQLSDDRVGQFKILDIEDQIPFGWIAADHKIVEENHESAKSAFGSWMKWSIVQLADGWQMGGSGHHFKVEPVANEEGFGQKLVVCVGQVGMFGIVDVNFPIPSGWTYATSAIVKKNRELAEAAFGPGTESFVVQLEDNHAMRGSEADFDIHPDGDLEEKCTHKLLVLMGQVEEFMIMNYNSFVPYGCFLAPHAFVEHNLAKSKAAFGSGTAWFQVQLADGWQMGGSGHHYELQPVKSEEELKHKLIVRLSQGFGPSSVNTTTAKNE